MGTDSEFFFFGVRVDGEGGSLKSGTCVGLEVSWIPGRQNLVENSRSALPIGNDWRGLEEIGRDWVRI
jgi:hypothetical protein